MGNINLIGVLISCLIAVLVLIEPFIMEEGKEYGIWEFCELLGLKESRTKDILKGLSDRIEIIGSNRDRRYKKH